MRPCLLIDVDFTLNPDFSGTWDGSDGDELRKAGWIVLGGFIMNDRPVWLNRFHGIKLLHVAEATGARLVWATRWHDWANQVISPALGLPQMLVAPCPPGPKPDSVIPWLQGRQFAWLDDEQEVIDGCNGSGVKVDPETGLTDTDIEKAVALLGRAE